MIETIEKSSVCGNSTEITLSSSLSPINFCPFLFVEDLNMLFHLGPNSKYQREKLTLWDSADFGKTWRVAREINSGFSAYSDMSYLERNRLALVYETDDYNQIIFERINLNK